MKILCLLIFTAVGAWAQCAPMVLNPITGLLDCTGPSGGAPTGAAGGDLSGTYPNPTIKASVSLTTPVIGVATGTSLTLTGAIISGSGSGVAGVLDLAQGTLPSLTTNNISFIAPTSVTAWGAIWPGSAPAGGQVPLFGTPSSSYSTITFATPALLDQTNVFSANSSSGVAALKLNGTWNPGATSCHVLIEPTGTTPFTASGAPAFCINAATGNTVPYVVFTTNGSNTQDFSIAANGSVFSNGSVSTTTSISAGTWFTWAAASRSLMGSPSNGVISMYNNDASAGVYLDIATNGTLKLQSTAGADTAIFTTNGLTASGSAVTLSGLGSASGTPDSVCLNTNTVKRNAATTCVVSSRDYKTNIRDLLVPSAADSLMQLRPVAFSYRDHPERDRWGLIAEEAAAVDRRLGDAWDANGVARSIDLPAILALLVKVAQDQQREIVELKAWRLSK